MPPIKRHKMLYEMRKSCNKATLKNIERSMRYETFTEIDLIHELHTARFIQKNWRMSRARKKFNNLISRIKKQQEDEARGVQASPRRRSLSNLRLSFGSIRSLRQSFSVSRASMTRDDSAVFSSKASGSFEAVEVEGAGAEQERLAWKVFAKWKKQSPVVQQQPSGDVVITGSGSVSVPPPRRFSFFGGMLPSNQVTPLPDVPVASALDVSADQEIVDKSGSSSDSSDSDDSSVVLSVSDEIRRGSDCSEERRVDASPCHDGAPGRDIASADTMRLQEEEDKSSESSAVSRPLSPTEFEQPLKLEESSPQPLKTSNEAHRQVKEKEEEHRIYQQTSHFTRQKRLLEDRLFEVKLEEVNSKEEIHQFKLKLRARSGAPSRHTNPADLSPMREQYATYQRAVRERRALTRQVSTLQERIAELHKISGCGNK